MKKFAILVIFATLFFFPMINSAQDASIVSLEGLETCSVLRFFFNDFQLPTDKEDVPYRQKAILKELAEKITLWNATLLIEGHADVTETPLVSYKNSKKRANIVKQILMEYGVPPKQILLSAKGEIDPPFSSEPKNHNNRTVIFQILFCPPFEKYDRKLIIATATRGGTYWPVGKLLAKMWSATLKHEGIEVEAILTQGSLHNIELLRQGEADIAILTSLVAYQATQGRGSFHGNPYQYLRAITALWPDVHHFMLSNNFVRTGNVEDLDKNVNFCVGREQSSTALSTNEILDKLGYQNVNRLDCGTYDETSQSLLREQYDGASLSGGIPISSVDALMSGTSKFKILEFTNAQALNLVFAFSYDIPSGTYGQNSSISTIAEPNLLVVNSTVDERIVRLLTEKFFENLPELRWTHDALEEVSLEKADRGLPVLIHPGAASIIE